MRVLGSLVIGLVLIGLTGIAPPAAGHAFAPFSVHLKLLGPQDVQVSTRRPRPAQSPTPLRVIWPDACALKSQAPHQLAPDGAALIETQSLRCTRPIIGLTVIIEGLDAHGIDAVVRLTHLDGRRQHVLINPGDPRWRIPETESTPALFGRYLTLGLGHLLGGWDHLLFILGLAVLIGRWRRVVWMLTAFTLGHSVTLALTAFGHLSLPQAPVEIAIAASVLWVGVRLGAASTPRSPKARNPWLSMALIASIGLIHGLGFAGALAEVGLPPSDGPLAIFGFNLGLELAQLGLVSLAWLIPWRRLLPRQTWRETARQGSGIIIGTLAVFWLWSRTLG